MNYKEAMEYIESISKFGSNYGLERMESALKKLKNPERELKIIHIGGTNGKGSTTAILKSILMKQGFKVGTYTSPALEKFEERITINNENITKEALIKYVPILKRVSEEIKNEENLGELTEFELVTSLMFKYFRDEKVDYAIVEVGLGGRLDATNVINPIASVFASISMDHMNILGDTIEEITREKSGIIKRDSLVITYPQKEEIMSIIKEVAKEKKSKVIEVSREECEVLEVLKGEKIGQLVRIDGYILNLPLLGEHQVYNCALAIKTYKAILGENIKKEAIIEGVKTVKWKGRLEVLKREPLVVIDGAHNIEGIKALARNIEKYFDYENMFLVIGILADKEVSSMINVIAPLAKEIVTVTPISTRAEEAKDLKKEIEKINQNVFSSEDYREAIEKCINKATKRDLILVTGSLYMIGKMRGIIRAT